MKTSIKKQPTQKQLAALDAGRRKPKGESARTANSSIRLRPDAKELLNKKLKKLNMSLADLLEAIARGDIEIVQK